MNNRLKSLRKKLDLTQAEFAEKLGISQTFLSDIEKGKKGFSASILLSLWRLNVNLDWFVGGEGSMFKEKSGQAEIESVDIDLLNNIVKELPLKRQKMVLNYAEDQRAISKILNEQNNAQITPK